MIRQNEKFQVTKPLGLGIFLAIIFSFFIALIFHETFRDDPFAIPYGLQKAKTTTRESFECISQKSFFVTSLKPAFTNLVKYFWLSAKCDC